MPAPARTIERRKPRSDPVSATGTVSVTSNDDGTVWTKVFDIHDINHDHEVDLADFFEFLNGFDVSC